MLFPLSRYTTSFYFFFCMNTWHLVFLIFERKIFLFLFSLSECETICHSKNTLYLLLQSRLLTTVLWRLLLLLPLSTLTYYNRDKIFSIIPHLNYHSTHLLLHISPFFFTSHIHLYSYLLSVLRYD